MPQPSYARSTLVGFALICLGQYVVVASLAQLVRRPLNLLPYFDRDGQVTVFSYTFVPAAAATSPGRASSEQ